MFSNRSPFNQPAAAPEPPSDADYYRNLTPPPLPQDDPGAQPPPATLAPVIESRTVLLELPPETPPISAQQAEYQWQRDQLTKIIARLDVATESKADLAESLQRHRNAIMQLVNGGIAHLDFLGAGLANLSNEDAQLFAYELGNLRKAVAALHLLIPLSLPSEQQAAE